MRFVCSLASGFCALLLAGMPASASHLVTGNGFGFAVISPETATVTRFYGHPYSFGKPDALNPLSEGIETPNFIKTLGWGTGIAQSPSAEYEADSQMIRVHRSDGEGMVFMPFGLRQACLIVSWEPGQGQNPAHGLQAEWSHPVRSHSVIRISGRDLRVLRFKGIEESLLLIPLEGKKAAPGQVQRRLNGGSAWALITLEDVAQLRPTVTEFIRWQAGLAAGALARREMAELEQWRVKPAVHFQSEKERHLWRESEVMLRMAQSREPNRAGRHNNGLIIASLPDGVWFTPWVRDMAYATVALAKMGHQSEARAALLAYFNAEPTGKMRGETRGADYQISVVRYFGDGSEEPFFTMEGATNIEFDDWGLALWALGEYERKYNDTALLHSSTYRGRLYESARDFVVKPLLVNTDKQGKGAIVAADTSIWEEHQKDQKHFAFSTSAAILGLRNFADIARQAGDEHTQTEAGIQIALLEKGFNAAFIRGGQLRGTLEEGVKNDIDGALLAMINAGIVTDPAMIRDTVERMELLRVRSGGYRRVRGTYTDPAIFEYWYEKQEFLFVDFSLAEVYRRLGRNKEAAAMLERIVDKAAADHNIIPEMYVAESCPLFPGELGAPTGALPMAGYGAGAYILHLLEREKLAIQP